MSNNNLFSSSEHLLKRFDNDVRAVYTQMQILETVFDNLKGSWFAISQTHKLVKIQSKKED